MSLGAGTMVFSLIGIANLDRLGGGGGLALQSLKLGSESLLCDCRHGQGAMRGGNPQAAVDVARDTNRAFAWFGFRDIFHS